MQDMGARRYGESEFDFVERRGRESEARWAAQDAAMKARPHAGRDPSNVALGPSAQDIANRGSMGRF